MSRSVLLLLAVIVGSLLGCGSKRPVPATNVLMIVVDTLRADHLGCHGYGQNTSPRVDQLAEEGARFSDATPQWPKTVPSMASLMTGTYPLTTGVRLDHLVKMSRDRPTLAETLKEHGYQTAAVVANFNVGRFLSFDRGFDRFVESWVEEVVRQTGQSKFVNAPGKVKRYTNAGIVTDQALELVESLATDRPYFLWLHYMDPHGPYIPPPGYLKDFKSGYEKRVVELEAIPTYQRLGGANGEPIRDLSVYVRQYDRSIRYFDDQLARLLSTLKERGRLENTLIIFTSDHGESLTENGYFLEHGAAPYQPTAHVPLFLVHPEKIPPGTVVDRPVGLIDIVPTILDVIGVSVDPALPGQSLLSVVSGEEEALRYVFMEAGEADLAQRVVRRGPWKLVHLSSERDRERFQAGEFELYRLDRDPSESEDQSATETDVARDLKEALLRWLRETPKSSRPGSKVEVDDDTRELMKQLGYAE